MFGRMMNNFYYGKSGKGDFKKEDLPKNRFQLFFEMLRIRFSALCRLNLMTILIFAAFAVSILSRYAAVPMRCPALVFIICGIFTLVPGAGIFWFSGL